jgi:hypothetical protein
MEKKYRPRTKSGKDYLNGPKPITNAERKKLKEWAFDCSGSDIPGWLFAWHRNVEFRKAFATLYKYAWAEGFRAHVQITYKNKTPKNRRTIIAKK